MLEVLVMVMVMVIAMAMVLVLVIAESLRRVVVQLRRQNQIFDCYYQNRED